MTPARVAVLLLKGLLVWSPAVVFWAVLALGSPVLDFRSDEEVQQEEHEAERLDRFFDVHELTEEAEYIAEWTAKDKALQHTIDKLLKSQRFMESLLPGAFDGDSSRPVPDAGAQGVEVSYVFTPRDSYGGIHNAPGMPGPPPWNPRMVFQHAAGSVVLVSTTFEHVPRAKDREERWACTALRADLVAYCDGERASERLCDLRGPVPHGVRYMRV